MNASSRKNQLILFLCIILSISLSVKLSAQVLSTETATASFFSEAPLENIEASNSNVRAALNVGSGELMFVVPIDRFEFKKSRMKEHFNKQYLESDKFPEAIFEGSILHWNGNPGKKASYVVEGNLTIHGITQKVTHKAVMETDRKILIGKSTFQVRLEDYKIKIPRMVIKNIAEVVEVKIFVRFDSENQ